MLKYVDTKVVFSEVPDEITLAVNISGCPCHCKGCHSAYLAEDTGNELNTTVLDELVKDRIGISCISFMGGDANPGEVEKLAKHIKEYYKFKVAWYSGRESITINLDNFDYIKLGPYKEECGPLNKETTNQVFYKVVHMSSGENRLFDITYRFWRV